MYEDTPSRVLLSSSECKRKKSDVARASAMVKWCEIAKICRVIGLEEEVVSLCYLLFKVS